MAKTDWVKFCVNYEHQQRRQALKDSDLLYLGDKFDVPSLDGEYKLMHKKEGYDERE